MGALPSPGIALGDCALTLRAAKADLLADILELSKLIIFCFVLTSGFPFFFIRNISVFFSTNLLLSTAKYNLTNGMLNPDSLNSQLHPSYLIQYRSSKGSL